MNEKIPQKNLCLPELLPSENISLNVMIYGTNHLFSFRLLYLSLESTAVEASTIGKKNRNTSEEISAESHVFWEILLILKLDRFVTTTVKSSFDDT